MTDEQVQIARYVADPDTPRIYVACLASYNAGELHGVWIDADQDPDDVWNEIRSMLRSSRHPNVEVTCPDCEGGGTEVPEGGLAAPGDTATLSGPLTEPCATCKGRGRVPSAEEHAIHDHEGFEGIEIGEYESIAKVCALAQRLADSDGEAFAAWYKNGSADDGNPDSWEDAFRDVYRGTWRSVEDYAEQFVEDCYDLRSVPDFIKHHIDYEGIARDLELGGDIWTTAGGDGVFVFDNH